MSKVFSLVSLVERGRLPDMMIRQGIRKLLDKRLATQEKGSSEANQNALGRFAMTLRESPLSLESGEATRQHYGLPPAFFREILGPRMKFSCCLFSSGTPGLEEAEEVMLSETCEKAGIADGMDILDLGCGWGALSLWIAEKYPRCRVTAVTNSQSQKEFIEALCSERGISTIQVELCDLKDYHSEQTFDRIVAVEIFEYLRNYKELLTLLAGLLKDDGRVFVHHFSHRHFAYPYEDDGEDTYLGRYFFSGGIMPAQNLLSHFQDDLTVENQWHLSGIHYKKTAEAWLARLDSRKETLLPILAETFGPAEAPIWLQRWRIFFMAACEMWGYRNGEEWGVSQYILRKK
jgi:cyclopropane-fatty-acyl-phospholipid synthase